MLAFLKKGAAMLSPVERELMRLLVVGASNKQIAHCLDISVEDVRRVIGRLMKQLGLSSRLELQLYAYSAGKR